MEIVIKTNITDSMTIEALAIAKKSRQMSGFVGTALAHYIRTVEGKKTLAMLQKGGGDKAKGEDKASTPPVKEPVKETVSVKTPRSIEDFMK